MIQINFDCGYLTPEVAKASAERMAKIRPMFAELQKKYAHDPAARGEAMRELRKLMAPEGSQRATLADVIAHINHVVQIAGIDAVGLAATSMAPGAYPQTWTAWTNGPI